MVILVCLLGVWVEVCMWLYWCVYWGYELKYVCGYIGVYTGGMSWSMYVVILMCLLGVWVEVCMWLYWCVYWGMSWSMYVVILVCLLGVWVEVCMWLYWSVYWKSTCQVPNNKCTTKTICDGPRVAQWLWW